LNGVIQNIKGGRF